MEENVLSDEYLDDIAKKAIFNGFIQPFNLARILGVEEDYGNLLPILWEKFECNRSGRETKMDTPNERTFAWYKLLRRWGGIRSVPPDDLSDRFWADPVLGKLPAIQHHLSLYNQHPVTGKLKIIPIKNRTDSDLIKLKDLREYLKDVERTFEVNFPLPKRLFPKTQEEEMEVTEKGNCFRQNGDYWEVSFNGTSATKIKHLKGMDYIKYLLENPNRPVAALALVRTRPTSEEASLLIKMKADQLEELGLSKSTSLGYKELISKETKDNYRNRLRELEEIINDRESLKSEVSEALREREALIKELKASCDKGTDKPRTAVSNAITRTITHIKKHHPSLAGHLKEYIHLGSSCIYTPPVDPNWNN